MTSDGDNRARIKSYHNGQGHITQEVKIKGGQLITKQGSQDSHKDSKMT